MNEQQERKPAEETGCREAEPAAAGDSLAGKASARTPADRPLKVLSTSLGAVLVANLLLVPHAQGETAANGADQPKLVEWSNEDVKQYFDPNADWNIPLPAADRTEPAMPGPSASPASGSAGGSAGGNTVIVQQGGGGFGGSFGWDDLLLYHMIFNRGGAYSSSGWVNQQPVYDARTNQPYQPRTYAAGTFQNKPVAGSNVQAPKTSAKFGTFNSKATSSTASSTGSKTGATSATSGSSVKSGTSSTSSTSSSSSSSSFSSSGKSTSSSTGSIGGKSGGFSSSGG